MNTDLLVYAGGLALGYMSYETSRIVDSRLRLQAEIDHRGLRTWYEFIAMLGSLAGTALFPAGFFLFRWWVPFATFGAVAIPVIAANVYLRLHPSTALVLSPVVNCGAAVACVYAWSAVFGRM